MGIRGEIRNILLMAELKSATTKDNAKYCKVYRKITQLKNMGDLRIIKHK